MKLITYKEFKNKMYDDYGLVTMLSLNGSLELTGQVYDGLGGETPILIYNAKTNKISIGSDEDLDDTEYTKQDALEAKPLLEQFINTPDNKKDYPKFYLWRRKVVDKLKFWK